MSTKKELLNRKSELLEYVNKATKTIEKEVEGSIKVSRNGKYISFYYVPVGKGAKAKYIPKKDKKTIADLLQKRYNHMVLKNANKMVGQIEKFLKEYDDSLIQKQALRFDHCCLKYLKLYESPDNYFVSQWNKKTYVKNSFPFSYSEAFLTMNNENVRSKSEVIIANCLKEAGIPYRYECQFVISQFQVTYPDFTILNVRTREEILWEHFGKMDSEDYRAKTFEKLNWYASKGIFPGHGLIVTFEDFKNPLSVRIVKQYINEMLI